MPPKELKKFTNKKIILARVIGVLIALAILYLFSISQNNLQLLDPSQGTGPSQVSDRAPILPEPKVTEFTLTIPKLNLSVNVIPNVNSANNNLYDEALQFGVAQYQNTAFPDSGSNIVIFGHSSGFFGAGPYATVFARLNNLIAGDPISIAYNGRTYQYTVSDKKIVSATDLSVVTPTEHEQLTLLTCWPVGTNKERLVVIAKPSD